MTQEPLTWRRPALLYPREILQIVGLRDVYESESHIFLIQELCGGGSLGARLQQPMAAPPLEEGRAANLFRGIIKSVLHCHQVRAHALYIEMHASISY